MPSYYPIYSRVCPPCPRRVTVPPTENALKRYDRWFGEPDDTRRTAVKTILEGILKFAYDAPYSCKSCDPEDTTVKGHSAHTTKLVLTHTTVSQIG